MFLWCTKCAFTISTITKKFPFEAHVPYTSELYFLRQGFKTAVGVLWLATKCSLHSISLAEAASTNHRSQNYCISQKRQLNVYISDIDLESERDIVMVLRYRGVPIEGNCAGNLERDKWKEYSAVTLNSAISMSYDDYNPKSNFLGVSPIEFKWNLCLKRHK